MNETTKKIILHDKATIKAVGHHTQRSFQPVVCIETGERFASMTDAAEHKGVTTCSISVAANDPKRRKCCGSRWIRAAHISEHADMLLDHVQHLHAENLLLKNRECQHSTDMAAQEEQNTVLRNEMADMRSVISAAMQKQNAATAYRDSLRKEIDDLLRKLDAAEDACAVADAELKEALAKYF